MLHRCFDWLERRDRGGQMRVNLRPDTEDATESMLFEPAQVRQCLGNAFMKIVTQPDGVRTLCIAKRMLSRRGRRPDHDQ